MRILDGPLLLHIAQLGPTSRVAGRRSIPRENIPRYIVAEGTSALIAQLTDHALPLLERVATDRVASYSGFVCA